MKLRIVPARQGTQWVRSGFGLFWRQPMAFVGLFMAFLLAAFVLSLLPWIGPLLMLMLLPLASLGFMVASQAALDGRSATPRAFIEPLRAGLAERRAIFLLGLLYALATYGIIALSDWADGGALEALLEALATGHTAPEVVADKVADPGLALGLFLRVGLAALLSIPFWHAPALVHWGRQTAGKALFFSTIACWRNKGAFAVYGLVWAGIIMLFGVLANLVFALLDQPQLVAVAAMPGSLIFSTVFYASLYATFDGCFAQSTGPLQHRSNSAGTSEADAKPLP